MTAKGYIFQNEMVYADDFSGMQSYIISNVPFTQELWYFATVQMLCC